MKLIKIFLLLLLVAVMNSSAADVSSSKAEKIHHVNDEVGYSIEFPPQWDVLKGVMGTDIMALAPLNGPKDLFRENVSIVFTKLDLKITPEEYYQFNLVSLRNLLEDFDLEISKDITVDGLKARKLIFTHTMGVVNAKVMQYLILNNKDAYVITFTADPIDFDTFLPKLEEIASTIRFKK